MAELQLLATSAQKVTVARSEGTPALGANEARVVIETDNSIFLVMQALRKIEADLTSALRTTGGAHVFAAVAFADNARFADGASFSDQNSLGL